MVLALDGQVCLTEHSSDCIYRRKKNSNKRKTSDLPVQLQTPKKKTKPSPKIQHTSSTSTFRTLTSRTPTRAFGSRRAAHMQQLGRELASASSVVRKLDFGKEVNEEQENKAAVSVSSDDGKT